VTAKRADHAHAAKDADPIPAPGNLAPEQQALVDAALEALQGSDAVDFSITEVVRRAGSNRTELYASFGSKDRLVLAAVAEAVRRTVDAIDVHLKSATGAQAIETWVRLILRRAGDSTVLSWTRPFALDAHRLIYRFPDAEDLLRLPLLRQLATLLNDDELSAQVPEPHDLIAEAIFGMVMHVQATHIARGSKLTRREIDVYVRCALRIAGLAPAAS
jgi:AcrR family transcriptional regulator